MDHEPTKLLHHHQEDRSLGILELLAKGERMLEELLVRCDFRNEETNLRVVLTNVLFLLLLFLTHRFYHILQIVFYCICSC